MPLSKCIYCGTRRGSLTDEHVVPYALAGRRSLVLKKSSCRKCNAITSKFERRVMRGLWGDARIAFNAPTRHPKDRKKDLLMPPLGGQESISVPASEYPAGFAFYTMNYAGMLQGLSEDDDISGSWQIVIIDDDDRRERFLAKHPEKELSIGFRHVPDDFARLLVKIGYGNVLTMLAPSDFRPLCVPYILGKKTNLSYIVGMHSLNQPPTPDNGYVLRTFGFGIVNEVGTFDRVTLLASVRLLSNAHTPTYHVVVGDIVGSERIQETLGKLGDMEIVLVPKGGEFLSDLFEGVDEM